MKNKLISLSIIPLIRGGIASATVLSSCDTKSISISTSKKSGNAFEQVNIDGSFKLHKFSPSNLNCVEKMLNSSKTLYQIILMKLLL
ncbi:MAG: hypothetical protein LBQ45_00855 [Mycoplasmataceae bacterium]|nr:hypothetical protein [Mycoplasmataceae bacterium]